MIDSRLWVLGSEVVIPRHCFFFNKMLDIGQALYSIYFIITFFMTKARTSNK